MKIKLLIIIGVFLLIFLSLFLVTSSQKNSNTDSVSEGKLHVSTSFYPLYFFASEIGGDKATVHNITPAGSEPHDYDPSTQDIARIADGDILVLNGGVEAWGDKIKDNVKGTKVKVIIAGENLFYKQLTDEGHVVKDTHIWLDPSLAKKEVAKITEGYIAIDPAHENYYKENQTSLDQRLDQLDSAYKSGLANCQSRDIVTSHAAFAYLAQRYGLTQVAISGISPDEEPSAKQLAQIANFAKQNNVKYIFFEKLVSPKLSETIAHEIGAQALVLDPLEGISDDDMKLGKNYFTVMEDNLKNLQKALVCNK